MSRPTSRSSRQPRGAITTLRSVVAAGVWLVQILVATTAGYALSVLRPRYGKVIVALVLATLFVPSIVLLVPLYLTIVQPPFLGQSLINTFWAVWLPTGANALKRAARHALLRLAPARGVRGGAELFLAFQRVFLSSAGMGGAVKG